MAASALVGPSTLAFARQSPRPLVSALCAASTSRSRPSKRRCFAVSASRSATELPSTVEVQQAIAKAKASDVVSASQTARAYAGLRVLYLSASAACRAQISRRPATLLTHRTEAERTMRRFWKQVGILDQPDGASKRRSRCSSLQAPGRSPSTSATSRRPAVCTFVCHHKSSPLR